MTKRPPATVNQALKHSNLGRSTFYARLVKPGRIRLIKIGRASRVDLDELDRVLEESKVGPQDAER